MTVARRVVRLAVHQDLPSQGRLRPAAASACAARGRGAGQEILPYLLVFGNTQRGSVSIVSMMAQSDDRDYLLGTGPVDLLILCLPCAPRCASRSVANFKFPTERRIRVIGDLHFLPAQILRVELS